MGRYFNPAAENAIAAAGGRSVPGDTHERLISQLREGERLGAFLDRYLFKQVADVTDPGEFEEFHSRVRRGDIRLIGHYAPPADRFH